MLIDDPLRHHARSRGTHPAIISGEQVITYRELDSMVNLTTARLGSLGLHRGDTVAVALRDTVDHVVLLFALARGAHVLLPIDWRWTHDEQERVIARFRAELVLVEPGSRPFRTVRSLPVDDAWRSSVQSAPVRGDYPAGDGPLLISLSSGTTGRPKGPCLSHSQFASRFQVHWVNLGFNSQDRYLCATPLYFGGGRSFVMGLLHAGATVVLYPPPYQPGDLCSEIARRSITTTFLVPTLLRRLLTLDDSTLAPMKRMRFVLSSGAALRAGERRAIRDRVCPGFIQYYASTEGGGITYLTADEPTRYDDSVGRPVFGVEVQCVDDSDAPAPTGQVGRIRFRGPAVADSFFNDPQASRDAFRDGWYYPGDLGFTDKDGYLYIKGRDKDVIIRGGINIYPADIEQALLAHPAVQDAAVVGWPSKEFNEEIAAFVHLRAAVSIAELHRHCERNLARYKRPRQVFVIPAMPRNSSGKILKTQLRAQLPHL